MSDAIAAVGLACRYPDARGPRELWENVLARRQAFRRMPACRLNLEDYGDGGDGDPDTTYVTQAAVLEGWVFDRVRHRVTGASFRAADLAHWLALEVAGEALADAGFPEGRGLPRETAGVLLGNTLTGDGSRANLMRLRWPYVRRVVGRALLGEGWDQARVGEFLATLERDYKAPFPAMDEESLAGGLANTIAGRICNHFDLGGGGYTLDGACSSSLLAVAQACTALTNGDLDLAIAGGVDLSLDPFELVGFARTGALSRAGMRPYDRRGDGFWPGEGCGLVVLMRHADALARGLRCYGLIRGWGISSDGAGGLTRPEVEGQRLALERAYARAGYGPGSVPLFEGHGTGTLVGDAVELKALNTARRGSATLAAIGSIKANIGHTKAAAGAAGLLKAILALHAQVLPPATAATQAHPELTAHDNSLRLLAQPEPWPADQPLRAGVSSFGFGGIDVHIALEGSAAARRGALTDHDLRLARGHQDSEVFCLHGPDRASLLVRVRRLAGLAEGMATAELADLAACLAAAPGLAAPVDGGPRAAVVAATPERLAARLTTLAEWLEAGVEQRLEPGEGVFLASPVRPPRIGLLFSGQASPVRLNGGAWARRFPAVAAIYAAAGLPSADDGSTGTAQPAIVAAERAVLAVLAATGLEADLGLGHSLGEYSALHWAGAMDGDRLQGLARLRGRLMAGVPGPAGAMAAVSADGAAVAGLLGSQVVVSCFNSPRQTVVSGEAGALTQVSARLAAAGLRVTRLPVGHAFHSPLMAPAVAELTDALRGADLKPLIRRVISTVTGEELAPDTDLAWLLGRQMTQTVQFTQALARLLEQVDLCLEAGPGQVLSGLVEDVSATPCLPLDGAGGSLAPLLEAIAAAFALGAGLDLGALFRDRLTRAFDPGRDPVFIASPCEARAGAGADLPRSAAPVRPAPATIAPPAPALGVPPDPARDAPAPDALDVLRAVVAHKAELPPEAVGEDSRLLVDLHLNSISVGQIVAEAARRLGLPPPASPTSYADATLGGIAQALRDQAASGLTAAEPPPRFPAGVDHWVHPFQLEWMARRCPPPAIQVPPGTWRLFTPTQAPAGLAEVVATLPGDGTLVWLPASRPEAYLDLLLAACREVLERRLPALVLVQQGAAAAPLVRSLQLEHQGLRVLILDLPPDAALGMRIRSEVAAATGFAEVRYTDTGERLIPQLAPIGHLPPAAPVLGPGDLLLVSGGGKGIAAESALALARACGVRLVLLGRSDPAQDPGLAANLERLTGLGVTWRYLRADVTDPQAVRAAVAGCVAELGPVTAILHGAGANRPHLLHDLTLDACAETLAPKVAGLANLLEAVEPDRLKALITFGSIIARSGMRGEADYAIANEALARDTQAFAATHPGCRCLCLEWSIWSGIGMGERLGRIEALLREGITPIAPGPGVDLLLRLLAAPDLPVRVVASGRLGELATLRLARGDLPLGRFLDPVKVHYPGLELVADLELSATTDPYLDDHALAGERLFPAVLGLEAMAQAAQALLGVTRPPRFTDVELMRPLVLPAGGRLKVRLAALARDGATVDLVLRGGEDGFVLDAFRARCHFPGPGPQEAPAAVDLPLAGLPRIAPSGLDLEADVYDALLFHTGRFRRIRGYRHLDAWSCEVEIGPGSGEGWFGPLLPAGLVLGDPGSRDAALHAIQACIPASRLLPVGADSLQVVNPESPGPWTLRARECAQDGDVFTYAASLTGADGTLREAWTGLRLRRVSAIPHERWHPELARVQVQRRLADLLPGPRVAVVLERRAGDGPGAAVAMGHALGAGQDILRRADGRPEPAAGGAVSAANACGLTLAVALPGTGGGVAHLACDLESVEARTQAVWGDLLGPDGLNLARVIAGSDGAGGLDRAATRVWGALECLKKDGVTLPGSVTLGAEEGDGWVVLLSGSRRIATWALRVQGVDAELVLAVLEGGRDARL